MKTVIVHKVVCSNCGRPFGDHAAYNFDTHQYVPTGGCGNYQQTIVDETVEVPER